MSYGKGSEGVPTKVAETYLEPWMRGGHGELAPLQRAVVHALELTLEDVERKAATLSREQIHLRPFGLPSVAFHLRHIARSLDRLLSYAEGKRLDEVQLDALSTEHEDGASAEDIYAEFAEGVRKAMLRVQAVAPALLGEVRGIGRQQLPTTVAGLLIHCADHTQRHSGQVVTTAQLVQRVAGRPWDAA